MNNITETVVEIQVSEPQADVLNSRAAVTLQMAGQGGGKTAIIAHISATFIQNFPAVKQFLGANTYLQLSQSTLTTVFRIWKEYYGFQEYDHKGNPGGHFVVDKRPPFHFTKIHTFPDYAGIISFSNGTVIFTGSLENYKAHDGKEFGIAQLDETKDTKEDALTEVIFGRLRQFGLWYDQDHEVHYCTHVNKAMADTYGWRIGTQLTPAMAEAMGWTGWNPLYIHSSPAKGGTPWLNKMFNLEKYREEIKTEVLKKDHGYFYKRYDNKCVVIYSTHHNRRNLPPNYIENQEKNQTWETVMRVVYGFPFGRTGTEYFPSWRRDVHAGKVPMLITELVNTSWDFNVVPYMTCLCIQLEELTRYMDLQGGKHFAPGVGLSALQVLRIRVYREYTLSSPRNSIEAICEDFAEEHPKTMEVNYYGDANGLNRIEGLGNQTRFKYVEQYLEPYLHNFSKCVRQPNVGVMTRRDLIEKILQGKIPEIELIVDEENCPNLIKDMEEVKQGPKGKLKARITQDGETFEAVGHTSDALEYFISEAFKQYIQ